MRNRFETTRGVKPRCEFVGDALVLDEATFTRQPDSIFVASLSIQLAAFEARDLGGYERRAVREIFGAVLRPHSNLPVVREKCVNMLPARVGRHGVAGRRPRQCSVEMVFGGLRG